MCDRLYSLHLQGSECCVYTNLTTANLRGSCTGIDYSVYSRPIDLRTDPMSRRPSQVGADLTRFAHSSKLGTVTKG